MSSQFTQDDAKQAEALYNANPTEISRAFLDLLIDNPGETLDSDAIQKQLDLSDHRDVARTTYKLGVLAGAMDRNRPWNEAQKGYSMSPEVAELFAQVRSAESSA